MTKPTEAEVEAAASAIEQGVCETCGSPAIGRITPQDCGRSDCTWGLGSVEQQARGALTAAAQVRERAPQPDYKALITAALPFATHDWMDAELEDNSCKLTKHSGPITVGHWRALRAAVAPLATEEYFIKRPATPDLGPLPIYGATEAEMPDRGLGGFRTAPAPPIDSIEDQGPDVLGMRKGEG